MARKTPLSGLIINVKPGEVISIGPNIRISAEPIYKNSPEISVVIDAPRSLEITRDNYDKDRGVLDAAKPGKKLYIGNLK